MTRDEAMAIVCRGGNPHDDITMTAAVFVDLLRFLNVLKLDEPKSAREKFEEVLISELNYPRESVAMQHFLIVLGKAGLKIVEK